MTTYSTGTLSVGAGSTSVTGVGTSWVSSGIRAGDILIAAGNAVPIAAVGGNVALTLARPWPGGALSGANYDVLLIDDNVRTLVAANMLMQSLSNGTLTSLAGLASAANRLPYFSGANTMALADLTAQARGLLGSTAFSRSGSDYTLDWRLLGTSVIQTAQDATTDRLLRLVGNQGAFGLGGFYGPQLADLDATTVPGGLYFFNLASGTVGASPGFNIGAILIMQSIGTGTNAPVQIALERTSGAGRMAWRNSQAGAWGQWRTVMGRGDMLGTVSQSGGVPTGALMETGTNANGRYYRYADGRQICEHARTVTGGATLADGALFRSSTNPNWTFPAAFVTGSPPAVYGDVPTAGMFVQCAARSTTNVSGLRVYSTVSTASDITHTMRAEGRWF